MTSSLRHIERDFLSQPAELPATPSERLSTRERLIPLVVAAVCLAPFTPLVTWAAFPIVHMMEGHVIIVQEYAFVPWFFVALNRLLLRPVPRNGAWLALAIGCMTVSGQPQILYYTLLFGFFWSAGSLAFGAASSARLRSLGWATAALACGCLLAAIQLVPSLELTLDGLSHCERGQAGYASQHSASATDFARMLVPNAFGNPLCELKRFDEVDFVHERVGYLGRGVHLSMVRGNP